MSLDTAAADRLPWLADEPLGRSAQKSRRRNGLPWAAGALALIVAAGLWFGVRSVEQTAPPLVRHASAAATLRLPPARPAISPVVQMPAQPDVRPTPVPDVHPSPARDVRINAPSRPRIHAPVLASRDRVEHAGGRQTHSSPDTGIVPPAAKVTEPVAAPPPFVLPAPWNPRIFTGAAGRMVQVGAFGSVRQAKRGWWFMVRAYPAMADLPAVVRPTRNSKGRVFYRFQVGTTSQAHSEVLCQRMEKITLSCAVVGLSWKAKVER